jgi:hypothetical protein
MHWIKSSAGESQPVHHPAAPLAGRGTTGRAVGRTEQPKHDGSCTDDAGTAGHE